MALFSCGCKRECVVFAWIASAIIGVLTAFLQITAVITVTPVFLWVAFGIAVVYLAVLVATAMPAQRSVAGHCVRALETALAGILGTVLFAAVLLAVGIVATSVVSAILAGLLLFFLALTFTGSACLVKCLADRADGQ